MGTRVGVGGNLSKHNVVDEGEDSRKRSTDSGGKPVRDATTDSVWIAATEASVETKKRGARQKCVMV